ncbi:MAG: cytochrome c biogenesis protein ResB [Thermodesulfovibrionales bacterium]|nr:cytochrome c biogenesis protein ResB [Thermodesulfovibrionales bacterium]
MMSKKERAEEQKSGSAEEKRIDKIWQIFSSVKTAIVLFVIISVSSIIGTVVVQNAPLDQGIESLSKFTGDALARKLYPLIADMGLSDMYGSWWFASLLFLFALNITICSIDRLPKVWKIVKEPIKPIPVELLAKMPVRHEFGVKTDIASVKQALISGLRKAGFKKISGAEGASADRNYICTEKGRYTRLGVYVVHFSIVLILAGAMINTIFGFSSQINIMEGDSSSSVVLLNGKERELNFAIRCDDFDTEYYPNSGRPRSYKSSLSIIKNSKEIARKNIDVNDPLIFDGIKIYQASYGFYFRRDADFIFRIQKINDRGQKGTVPDLRTPSGVPVFDGAGSESGLSPSLQTLRLKYGETFKIPGTNITGKVVDFNPSFAIDQNTGQPYIREKQMSNPAVGVEFYEKGALKDAKWIFKRIPDTWKVMEGYTIEFVDLWGVQYTTLLVNRMPGLPVIYTGFIILSIGLYMAFFMSHQKIWIKLSEKDKPVKVLIAGSANKGGEGLKRKIERLAEDI